MKYFAIILLSLLSVSCLTVKKVKRNCELFAAVCITETETETTTEIKTEIEYRDTTGTIHIPEEKVRDKTPVIIEDKNKKQVPIKKEYINSELSVLKVPFAKSTAQVVNSRLIHKLTQTDTLLLFKLEGALKTIKKQEKQITVLREKYVITITENSNFANFTIKVFWVLVVISGLGIGYMIFKYKTRILSLFK